MLDSPQPERRVLKVYSEFGRAVQEGVGAVTPLPGSASTTASSLRPQKDAPVAGRVAEAKRLFEARVSDASGEDSASITSSDLSAAASEGAGKQESPTIWGRLKNAAVQNKYVSGAVSKLTEAAEAQRVLACERADAAAAERDAALQQRDEALCLLRAMQRERDDALQHAVRLRRARDESQVLHVFAGEFVITASEGLFKGTPPLTPRACCAVAVAGGVLLAILASGPGEHKQKAVAATAALVLLGRNAALSCLAAGLAVALLDRTRGGGVIAACSARGG